MNSLANVLSGVFYEMPPIKVGGTDDWFERSKKRADVSMCDPVEHFRPSPHVNYSEYHSPYYETTSLRGRQLPPDRALSFKQVREVLGIYIFTECANTYELLSFAEHHPKKLHNLGMLFSVGRDDFSGYRYGSMLISNGKHFVLKRVDLDECTFRRNAQFLFRCRVPKQKPRLETHRFSTVPS